VSVVFHAKFEEADTAFSVHHLQGKTVRLDIYEVEDD
jgi:hypothetical protein